MTLQQPSSVVPFRSDSSDSEELETVPMDGVSTTAVTKPSMKLSVDKQAPVLPDGFPSTDKAHTTAAKDAGVSSAPTATRVVVPGGG